MASLVWLRVSGLMSVMAIREQPERAKPLQTAAPMPVIDEKTVYACLCVLTYPSPRRLSRRLHQEAMPSRKHVMLRYELSRDQHVIST